ncbi:hypothetical protein DFH09DRAFT_1104639 [Mycena vulgaris]|nr:hypothetical protein DFH09DRAFT_1104639 [Mycena vulgaris]
MNQNLTLVSGHDYLIGTILVLASAADGVQEAETLPERPETWVRTKKTHRVGGVAARSAFFVRYAAQRRRRSELTGSMLSQSDQRLNTLVVVRTGNRWASEINTLLTGVSIERCSVTIFVAGINSRALFPDSSSKEPTGTTNLLAAGIARAAKLQSVLDRLGKYSKFLQTVLALGLAASEVNSIAKAVFASVDQIYKLPQEQNKCDADITALLQDITDVLACIADV